MHSKTSRSTYRRVSVRRGPARGRRAAAALARALALCPLSIACSCVTARGYVASHQTYSVTRGRVLELEGLECESREHLWDGVALVAGGDGCRATVDLGGEVRALKVHRGGIVVLRESEDYVLEPAGHPVEEPAACAPPAPDDVDAALADHAAGILDTISAGSFPEAMSEINQLPSLFPGSSRTPEVQAVLQLLLGRATSRDQSSQPLSPGEALEALERGKALLAGNELEAARKALERAHALDPDNPDVRDALVGLLKKMGLELYGKGKWKEAVDHWDRALQIRPDDEEVRRFLARAEDVRSKL